RRSRDLIWLDTNLGTVRGDDFGSHSLEESQSVTRAIGWDGWCQQTTVEIRQDLKNTGAEVTLVWWKRLRCYSPSQKVSWSCFSMGMLHQNPSRSSTKDCGTLPADRKLGSAVPIYMRGLREAPEKYRPASLTS
ncbi:unnamed protein product, partial [Bubo scandiacus]